MTQDTIRKMGNALAIFSDPYERAFNEVLAKPIYRPRGSRSEAFLKRDALKVEFDVRGRQVLKDYTAALASGVETDKCFMQCVMDLAAVVGADTGMDFGRDCDLTFGKIQYVINKTEAMAYVDYFWDYLGSRVAGINEKRLADWFLAPDSPRHRFRDCHCLMDDETMERAVREYREKGTNEVIRNGRWKSVSWRLLVFLETGDRCSIAWYDKFQTMAAELAEPLGLYPIEFLFCDFL